MPSPDDLDQKRRELLGAYDEGDWQNYHRIVDWLHNAGTASAALGVGDFAPDFLLPDADGRLVSTLQLRQAGPLVVSFYRGGWCPFCRAELQALHDARKKFEAAGVSLIVVSPDTMHFPRQLRQELGLDLQILSDVDYGVAISYGLLFPIPEEVRQHYLSRGVDVGARHGSRVPMLPLPATYVINTEGLITSAFVDIDYTVRQKPRDIITALQSVET